jgi:hypothetical protein
MHAGLAIVVPGSRVPDSASVARSGTTEPNRHVARSWVWGEYPTTPCRVNVILAVGLDLVSRSRVGPHGLEIRRSTDRRNAAGGLTTGGQPWTADLLVIADGTVRHARHGLRVPPSSSHDLRDRATRSAGTRAGRSRPGREDQRRSDPPPRTVVDWSHLPKRCPGRILARPSTLRPAARSGPKILAQRSGGSLKRYHRHAARDLNSPGQVVYPENHMPPGRHVD